MIQQINYLNVEQEIGMKKRDESCGTYSTKNEIKFETSKIR